MAQEGCRLVLLNTIDKNMSSMIIQFHCLPAEIAGFIARASIGLKLYFVLVGGPPVALEMVDADDLLERVEHAGRSRLPMTLYILGRPPNLPIVSGSDFYDANPENIVVEIGTLSVSGLMQSIMSTRSTDAELVQLAKKLAKEVKKNTHAGVTAVNVNTGVRGLAKSFRYSDAALALEKKGVNMLPYAGGAKLILGNAVN